MSRRAATSPSHLHRFEPSGSGPRGSSLQRGQPPGLSLFLLCCLSRFEVKKDSFKQLRKRFQSFLAPSWKCEVPLELFVPATLAVLCINKPERIAKRQ